MFEMDVVYFPVDFSTEEVKPKMASEWTNAQVLDALNKTVDILAVGTNSTVQDLSVARKNYQCIANEIRRRMQANVENFVQLELERFYDVDKETGQIENEEDMPHKYDSLSSAYAGLETLADVDDDIVFVGISPEEYMRAWNRMVERKQKRIFYYDDENDEERLTIHD